MALPLRYNVRNLFRRKLRTALTVLGIALVIATTVMMLAYARGLLFSLRSGGDPDNVLVLSRKASDYEFSSMSPADFERLASIVIEDVAWHEPDITADDIDLDDFLSVGAAVDLVAPYVTHTSIVRLDGPAGGRDDDRKLGLVKGVDPARAFEMSRGFEILEGRALDGDDQFAAMVGSLVWARLGVAREDLAVKTELRFSGATWPVVGVFDGGGTGDESDIWVPIDGLMTVLNRTTYNYALLKVEELGARERVIDEVNRSDQMELRAVGEIEYYRGYAETFRTFAAIGMVMALVITLGGLTIGMNTMYTAIRGRVREIGMLQVLGFSRRAILFGLLWESLGLALLGGALGCLLGSLINGWPMKVTMGVFVLRVDWMVIGAAMALAAAIGLVGAWVPARRALRLRIVDAMRSS